MSGTNVLPGGQWWRRILPTVLRPVLLGGYQRAWLRGDLLAGLTVTAYLVPQVMAHATVAGLPPVAGLWAALPAIAAYALLGSSHLLSMGPESTTALMTATVIGPLAAGNSGRYAGLAAALALVVGVLCVAAWLARLGFVADLLSRPVLIGFLAGVALIMMANQLPKLTGVPEHAEGFFPQLGAFVTHIRQTSLPTVAVGAATIAFLFLAARFAPGGCPSRCSPPCWPQPRPRRFTCTPTASRWSERSPPGCPAPRCPT